MEMKTVVLIKNVEVWLKYREYKTLILLKDAEDAKSGVSNEMIM